ncbi:hypothetical protein PR202_ga30377 [Eleusine coracana subsp. coracana]|uniref:VWFA domain-containing protein n=1 Tax=Eleusine coracana subsp. coracana TaxID=191504 RepID=A0AAV5DNU4_ELECO|nr:hypothetical protein PR202_ga30377 [Eleusine coracana subsp. coracana]
MAALGREGEEPMMSLEEERWSRSSTQEGGEEGVVALRLEEGRPHVCAWGGREEGKAAALGEAERDVVAAVGLGQPDGIFSTASRLGAFHRNRRVLLQSIAAEVAFVTSVPVFPQIPSNQGRNDFHVLLNVEAAKKSRVPIDLIFVHSVSKDALLADVKKAIEFSSSQLLGTGHDDLLTIVGPSNGDDPVVDSLSAAGEAKEKMENHSTARIGGATFETLLQKATEGFDENEVVNLVKQRNYPVHTFGLGPNHESKALHRIASASTGGTYSFVDDANLRNISAALAVCVGGLKNVVVPGSSILKLEASVGVKITRIQYGVSENNPTGTESSAEIKIGMLHAGETKKIVVHLDVDVEGNKQREPQESGCGEKTLLTASFFLSSNDSAPTHKRAVCVERPQHAPAVPAPPSPLVLQQIVSFELIHLMVNISDSATSGMELVMELVDKWGTFVQDHQYWSGIDVLLAGLQEEIDAMMEYASSNSASWAAYINSWISSYETQRPTAMGSPTNVVGVFLTEDVKIMVQVAIHQQGNCPERNCFDAYELADLILTAIREKKLIGKPCSKMDANLASLVFPN